MNAAAEFIVRWHLNRFDISQEDRDTIIAAVSRGYELGQKDAIDLVDSYISLAVEGSRGLEDAVVIDFMVRLHHLFEANSLETRYIDAVMAVQKVLGDHKPGLFADRILNSKVMGIAAELDAHAQKLKSEGVL